MSFAAPQDLKTCLQIGQSVMLDNGAFSAYTRGAEFEPERFYAWLGPILSPPHWAVVPDVIGGSVEDQRGLLRSWPWQLGRHNACPVWHLDKPLSYLCELVDGWPKVALGSAGEYWEVGSDKWARRMDEAFNELARVFRVMPWIHGMRMLGQHSERWPLASADSTNVAQNFKRNSGCAECMAAPIDSRQPSARWNMARIQAGMFE